MRKVKQILSILLIALVVNNSFSRSIIFSAQKNQFTDVIIGSKTGDSTGTITISNSTIQQNIISTIPLLSGLTISNDQTSLTFTPITCYLVFKATDNSGVQKVIAVELEIQSSTLVYKTNNGREVHVCNGYGGCSSCAFIKMDNRIITCNCNQSSGNSNTESGCQHIATWLHQ